ncbi:hypothetical protein AXFE_03210 [Acidithrix ferrooxidans]|uniref:Uncharacterized protein n=1 Tax=Acidithrix ferrooxidans TaxID=1280514 RepID=A0A0D8HLI4_9ACTN|nr:hypothetical protein AXFE_03210 [Acidithrix ferrooxidans]
MSGGRLHACLANNLTHVNKRFAFTCRCQISTTGPTAIATTDKQIIKRRVTGSETYLSSFVSFASTETRLELIFSRTDVR